MTPLDQALDQLDSAIPDQPATVDGCGLCWYGWELEALSGPRDEVPVEVMGQMAREVPDHWTDFPGFYRRMTPRILRLVTAGELTHSMDVVADRLQDAGWRGWQERERSAVLGVFEAWWRATLATHPSEPSVSESVEFLVGASTDIRPWLDIWTRATSAAAAAHVSDLCTDIVPYGRGDRLVLGHHDQYDVTEPLVDWMRSHGRERLVAAGHDPYPLDLLVSVFGGT